LNIVLIWSQVYPDLNQINQNICKLKNDLEKELNHLCEKFSQKLEELKNKNRVLQSKKNLTVALSSNVEDEQGDNDFDNEEEDEDAENYAQRQNILTAFKRGKFKTGVTVEKNTNNSGISFKDLMDGVSSGSISVGDDFKMTDNGVKKTDQQILEELRIEASSKSRVIQID
jgi:cell division protein ZapA (FtsZ GTPase activity inhibitor)